MPPNPYIGEPERHCLIHCTTMGFREQRLGPPTASKPFIERSNLSISLIEDIHSLLENEKEWEASVYASRGSSCFFPALQSAWRGDWSPLELEQISCFCSESTLAEGKLSNVALRKLLLKRCQWVVHHVLVLTMKTILMLILLMMLMLLLTLLHLLLVLIILLLLL